MKNTKTLESTKAAQVEDFADDARVSEQSGNNTEDQLSSSLISVTLAFVALIAAAISSSEILQNIQFVQKILIFLALVVFCISIIAGLANYFNNMRAHRKNAARSDKLAERADDAESKKELSRLEAAQTVARVRVQKHSARLLLTQIALLCLGLGLVVAFVGSLLFS